MAGHADKRSKRRVVSSNHKSINDGKNRGWMQSKALLFTVTALSAAILVQGSPQLLSTGATDDSSSSILSKLLQDPQNFKGMPSVSGGLDAAASSLVSKAATMAGTYSPTATGSATGVAAKIEASSSSSSTAASTKSSSTSAAKSTSSSSKSSSSAAAKSTSSSSSKASSSSSKASSAADAKSTSSSSKASSSATTKKSSSSSKASSSAATAKSTSSTKAKSTTASATSATSATVVADTAKSYSAPERWTWVAGAFGCPSSATPYGTEFLCSGKATSTAASAKSTSTSSTAAAATAKSAIRIARDVNDDFADMGASSSFLRARQDASGNGGPPTDVNNPDSPDLGWLDTVVGGVPYKNGDLAASIVWVLAVLFLIPLFLIRLLRRSSLIAHILFTIFIWGCVMVAAMGIRAYLSNSTPRTTLMIIENILLQILPPLLLEPLLNLLAMYARQGNERSGVPTVALLLRFFNLVALILFAVTAAYTGVYLHQWDQTLMDPNAVGAMSDFPDRTPIGIIRIGPIVGAFLMVIAIAGGLLLIPVARGENGSMRPGGFLAVLFAFLAITTIYRILQTLHAQGEISTENGNGSSNPFQFATQQASTVDAAKRILGQLGRRAVTLPSAFQAQQDASLRVARASMIAPPGMYNAGVKGIDWEQLQQTLASRGTPQTPVIFNLVYILPMWLEVFMLFFVHAPGHTEGQKLQPAAIQPMA